MSTPFIHRLVGTVALGALTSIAGGCSADDTTQQQSAVTGCEGAYVDGGGRCRLPNGRFAKAVCCEAPATPTTRRSLEAYRCPDEPSPIPVAFFDADSTLRVSRSGTPTASSAEDVYVLPFAAPVIEQLQAEGFLVAVVSNQGGVAAGITPYEVAEDALVFTAAQLHGIGAQVDYLDFADQRDEYRKPAVGMATHLEELLLVECGATIDWSRSQMIGDAGYQQNVDGPHPDGRPADDFSNSDRRFAENLGIVFAEPTDAFGWRDFGYFNVRYPSHLLGLLGEVDERIAELEQTGEDPERLAELAQEVAAIRDVNDL